MPKDNAILIYESLEKYSDIQNLIGQQEEVYMDFKESKTVTGSFLDDDKNNFSKAASGFAHQDGGVIIWGIEARKNKEGIDEAISLRPIKSIKMFFSGINDYIKNSTIPVVEGILNKKIFINDDSHSDSGFIISYFPKSNYEHAHKGLFYKRYGDSFVKLVTPSEIKSLFFRSQSPALEFENQISNNSGTLHIPVIIVNTGNNLAKNVQILISFEPRNASANIYDDSGNTNWKISSHIQSSDKEYPLSFLLNGGIVIHAGSKMKIATMTFLRLPLPQKMKYKILAENMYPVEDEIIINPNS